MARDYYEIAKKFYSDKENVSKIVPFLKDRETAFLCKSTSEEVKGKYVRYKRIQDENDFYWNGFKLILQNKVLYNIYNTVATYKEGVPKITYAGMSSEQMNKNKQEWNENHQKHMIGYDWFIDFDSPSYSKLDHVAKDVLKVIALIEKSLFSYRVVFSGCGFQLIIPHNNFAGNYSFDSTQEPNIYANLQYRTTMLRDSISETIDLSIFDSLRICKTPNCLIVNIEKSKDIYVSKIMTKEELEKFDLNMVKYKCR